MKAKRSNYTGAVFLLLIAAAGVYGLGVYIKKTPDAEKVPQAIRRVDPENHGTPAGQATQPKATSAKTFTPKSSQGNLSFDEMTEDVPAGTDPMVFAVNRFMENSHITPANARAISVDIKEGVAYISFTEAMDKTYGSSDEEALIKGLQKTVGQFPKVTKVVCEVSGKPIDTFGNVDIHDGIEIKPPAEQPKQPGA
jgi:hypothetical protein